MSGGLLTGTTILLVEDNEHSRFVLSQFLIRSGAVVIVCASLSEAADRIASSRPDLLLTDIQLPDGTGFEVLRILQELDHEASATPAGDERQCGYRDAATDGTGWFFSFLA